MPYNSAIFPIGNHHSYYCFHFQGQKNTMRNLDFLTMINLTTQLYRSLCALLAKITMVFYSITEKKHINLMSKRCCQRVPLSLLQEGEIPQAIPEEGIACGSVFSMFFLSTPVLIFRRDHCHADEPMING